MLGIRIRQRKNRAFIVHNGHRTQVYTHAFDMIVSHPVKIKVSPVRNWWAAAKAVQPPVRM